MLVYQKAMFDRYYCIKSFCQLKLENASKSSFSYYYNGAQNVGFENACSRVNTYALNNVHFYARYW